MVILQEVEGGPIVKSKVLHLFRWIPCLHLDIQILQKETLIAQHGCRDSGVILLASGGAGLELLQIWG